MADRVGQQLGNYRLTRLLGRGGFAEVYLGEHLRLNMQAAVKVLHTELADSDIENFHHEAETIASLIHPHIVRVLDFDVKNGVPFLVMDYAPNGSLRRLHPRNISLPLPTIVSYVKQVADALQYAHEQKLIHRDVKPENMLLGRRNEVLLSDFGIAIIAQSSRYQGKQDMAGTITYMAPEQIKAHPRSASDQYALGVVVYEWLCGDRPFHGTFTEIAAKHTMMPPPPLSEKMSMVLPEVEQVVLTALEKEPHKRFASVQAFATAFEQACQHSDLHPFAASFNKTSSSVIALPPNSTSSQSIPNTLTEQSGLFTETISTSNQISLTSLSTPYLSQQPSMFDLTSPPDQMPLPTPLSPNVSQQPIDAIAASNTNIVQHENSISSIDQSLQSTAIINPPIQTQKFLPIPFSQQAPQNFSQPPKYTHSQTASAKNHRVNNRTVLGIGIVLTLIVLILGGVVGFVVLSNTAQTQNSGQGNTAASQGTRTTEPLNSPAIQPIPLGFPQITDLSNTVERANGTTYTLTTQAVNKQNQPVHASDITCKLWLVHRIPGNTILDIPVPILKDVNNIQNPITGYVNGRPFEEVSGLTFDSSTPQTHFCNANGQFTWKFQISSSVQPGDYDLVVLTDWNGVHYIWSWVNIYIK